MDHPPSHQCCPSASPGVSSGGRGKIPGHVKGSKRGIIGGDAGSCNPLATGLNGNGATSVPNGFPGDESGCPGMYGCQGKHTSFICSHIPRSPFPFPPSALLILRVVLLNFRGCPVIHATVDKIDRPKSLPQVKFGHLPSLVTATGASPASVDQSGVSISSYSSAAAVAPDWGSPFAGIRLGTFPFVPSPRTV